MARPIKNNADYFPHDNNMRDDERIKAVRRKFKYTGYYIWNMLLERLCKEAHFQLEYNEEKLEFMAGDFDIDPELLKQIIDYFIKIKLIEIKSDFIFSRTLINRFEPLLSKRKYNLDKKLKNIKEIEYVVSAVQNDTNTALLLQKQHNNSVLDIDKAQSKVKESKVKKRKSIKRKGEKEKEKNSAPDFFQKISGQENLSQEKIESEKSEIRFPNPSETKKNQNMIQEQKNCAKKVLQTHQNGQNLEIYKNLFQTYVPSYLWETWDLDHLEHLVKKVIQVKLAENSGLTGVLKFEYFLKNLPNYWKTKKMTVPQLNQNFNEIINEINTLKQQSEGLKNINFSIKNSEMQKKVVYQSPKINPENHSKIKAMPTPEQIFEQRKTTINSILEIYQSYCQTGSFGFLPKWTFYDFIIQEKVYSLDKKKHLALMQVAKIARQDQLKITSSPLNGSLNLKILEQYAENKISESEQKQIQFEFKSLVVIAFFEHLKAQNTDIKTIFKNS